MTENSEFKRQGEPVGYPGQTMDALREEAVGTLLRTLSEDFGLRGVGRAYTVYRRLPIDSDEIKAVMGEPRH